MLEGLDPTFLLAAPLVTISLIGGAVFTWWIKRPERGNDDSGQS